MGTSLEARKKLPGIGERDPLPKGYGIRTGLSDLLKPLNSEAGVTAKEESLGTYVVLLTAIVLLFLFYVLLLLINNQSVLLPPEDEFDEYVANFLPYFFFGEKRGSRTAGGRRDAVGVFQTVATLGSSSRPAP